MGFWPEFSETHKSDLKRLGVSPPQLKALRQALLIVREVTSRAPPNADVREILAANVTHSKALAQALRVSTSRPEASAAAAAMVGARYWRDPRVAHTGPSVAAYLVPLLDALTDAARDALRSVPKNPVRHKSADPVTIETIANALAYGWEESQTADAHSATREPLPKEFRPNWSKESTFAKIASICFDAVGGNTDPERAIKAYMYKVRKKRAATLDGLDALAAGTDRTTPSG